MALHCVCVGKGSSLVLMAAVSCSSICFFCGSGDSRQEYLKGKKTRNQHVGVLSKERTEPCHLLACFFVMVNMHSHAFFTTLVICDR